VGRAGRTLRTQTTDLERQRDELAGLLEERRDLLARLVSAQEEERARVAEDIHDDSIQAVTEVALRLDGLRRFIPDDVGQARLDTIEASLRGALDRMRNLMFDLRPPALDEAGLVAAFNSYLARAWGDLDLEHTVESRLKHEPPNETRTIAYRIGQEALANVRKHARASRCHVLVEDLDGGLRLVVTDDGVGLSGEPQQRPDHLGVVSMRERAAMAGGWCRLTGAPGVGTTVEVWLPLPGRDNGGVSSRPLAEPAQADGSGVKP
jgi:signal transduction histidine kinase